MSESPASRMASYLHKQGPEALSSYTDPLLRVFFHNYCAYSAKIVQLCHILRTHLSSLDNLSFLSYHLRRKRTLVEYDLNASLWSKLAVYVNVTGAFSAASAKSALIRLTSHITASSWIPHVSHADLDSWRKAITKSGSFPEKMRSSFRAHIFFAVLCSSCVALKF